MSLAELFFLRAKLSLAAEEADLFLMSGSKSGEHDPMHSLMARIHSCVHTISVGKRRLSFR